tara:strand:+ start:1940 stop:2113 length:174 start_codon:yes stop_codon:yes gene_type:complete
MIVEKLRTILAELTEAELDAEKCEDGNASAGRRLRKASMIAIKQLKELRAIVLEKNK